MADDFPDFVKFDGFAGQAWYHQMIRDKRILRRAREFTPERLFKSGEQGVWYDPSDTTTLFQDSAGTTPVTASGQPVGLMLDKSKGLVRGPELVVNGGFDDGLAGWTAYKGASDPAVAVEAGKLRLVVTTAYAGAGIPFSTAVGSSYELHLEQSGDSGQLLVGTAINSGSVVNTVALGMYRRVFVATTTTTWVSVSRGAVGTVYFDNISVRELPGNHATQPTAASRPIYRRGDSRGVVNLLTWSEDFSNAGWTKANATVNGPEVTTTATGHALYRIVPVTPGASYVMSFIAKRGSMSDVKYSVYDLTSARDIVPSTSYYSRIDASGYTRVSVPFTAPEGCLTIRCYPMRDSLVTGTTFVTDVQVNLGPTALPYQRNDATLGGVATGASTDLHWLETDGVDDGMVTGNINFTGTDKVSVFTGVRKLSDSQAGTVVELSASTSVNNRAFVLNAPYSNIINAYGFVARGTIRADLTGGAIAAPHTAVVSAFANIAAVSNTIVQRRNGAPDGAISSSLGTGNFGNYPLYLFRRGGTSLPFNGWFYGLAITGRLTTDAETVATERYLAAKASVVIP